MIRPAIFADIPRICELMVEAQPRSAYAELDEVDVPHVKKLLMAAIPRHGFTNAAGTWVMVAEEAGQVEGSLFGMLDRVQSVGRRLFATDVWWFISDRADPRDGLRLLDSFDAWAWSVPGVVVIQNGATDVIGNAERTGRILQRRGRRMIGGIYEARRP